MKKTIILLFSFLFVNLIFAQKNAIKITNQNTGKEKTIKEYKRIKVKTVNGEKISGRFKIIDNESFMIKNKVIKLIEIEKIKRNPLLISTITKWFFIYAGSGMIFLPMISVVFIGDSYPILWAISGAGMIYVGIKSPNLLKGFKKVKQWKYEIIQSSE